LSSDPLKTIDTAQRGQNYLDSYADINTLQVCHQSLISMENEPSVNVGEKSKREKEAEVEKRKERKRRWEMWKAPG